MYVRMFIWHHLGGQFSQNHKMKTKAYKSHTHISPFNQKIWFLKRCDMLLSFHQLKCPPLSKCRGSLEFFHGLLLQLPTYDNSNPPPVTLREPRQLGRLHWLLESGLPHVYSRGGKKRTGKPIRQKTLVESRTNTATPKKTWHTMTYTLSLFFVGREGSHRKKKKRDKPNTKSHRFLPPSSGRHGFRFLSNVAKCSTSFLRMRRISRRVGRLFM